MNTFMWENPLTRAHLALLARQGSLPELDLDGCVAWINQHCPWLRIVPPQSKRLACGDVGVGGLAELDSIVAAVRLMLERRP
jgi:phosphopantothenoylcysteine decarboxylase